MPKKNVLRKQRRSLGFPHRSASESRILAVVHTKSLLTTLDSMITLPLCVCVRRKWGAVGVRAVSCWWEWDKNLFPLLKPTALSEASVFLYKATYTQLDATCTDTHLQ